MTGFAFFVVVVFLATLAIAVIATIAAVRYGKMILDYEAQLEEALDVLDESYAKLSRAAGTELMSDEPVVKQVVRDIKASRDAVLVVANTLTRKPKRQGAE